MKGFNKAWNRIAKALRDTGYTVKQLEKAREGLDYGSRPSLIKKRLDKAAVKETEKNRCPGVPIVVPYEPGQNQVARLQREGFGVRASRTASSRDRLFAWEVYVEVLVEHS